MLVDMRHGYHQIDIFSEHQTYLGFSWFYEGKLRYFVFTVLPFGLSVAPFCFTKIVRALVKFWLSNGIKIVVFIDDGAGAEENVQKASYGSKFVKQSLVDSEFLLNEEKSVWYPVQLLEWLGNVVQTVDYVIAITEKRSEDILCSTEKILISLPYTTPRKMALAAGKFVSPMFLEIFPV